MALDGHLGRQAEAVAQLAVAAFVDAGLAEDACFQNPPGQHARLPALKARMVASRAVCWSGVGTSLSCSVSFILQIIGQILSVVQKNLLA